MAKVALRFGCAKQSKNLKKVSLILYTYILARPRLILVSMSVCSIDLTLDLDMLDIVKYIFLILTIQSVFKNH